MKEQFIQAIRNLNPNTPLTGKEIEDFYVPRPDNPYSYLKNYLLSEETPKIPVTGPIGVGKSTELNVIRKNLEESFLIISPIPEDMAGKEEMGYISFIFLLIREMVKITGGEKIPLKEYGIEPIFASYNYERIAKERHLERHPDHKEIFTLSLSENREKEIYNYLNRYQDGLYSSLSLIKNSLEKEYNKKVLFIFDDFEKLEPKVIEEIFINHSDRIKGIPFPIIFTFPLVLSYSPKIRLIQDYYEKPLYLYPIDVERRASSQSNEESIKFFQEVLEKRAFKVSFQTGIVEEMARSSGGLIRIFLNLARNSIRNAMMDNDDMVKTEHLERELQSSRETYFRLLKEDDYVKIKPYLTPNDAVPSGIEKYLIQDIILEHRDQDGIWYKIIPIITPLVNIFFERRGMESMFNK